MILNFLTNPFANSRIGNRRFAKFIDEHRGRVRAAADLPAGATVALAAVDAAYATFLAAEKTNAVASAVRQGKTVTNDAAIRRCQRFVSQQASLIAGALRAPRYRPARRGHGALPGLLPEGRNGADPRR